MYFEMKSQKKSQRMKMTNLYVVVLNKDQGHSKNEAIAVDNDSDDACNDGVEIQKTCVYGNVASYYLDERIWKDNQDIYNENFFLQYEFYDAQLNDHYDLISNEFELKLNDLFTLQ